MSKIGYGKLNNEGYLMSSQVQADKSWSPLEDFEDNGQTADYFKADKTIDKAKEQAVATKQKLDEDLAEFKAKKEQEANIALLKEFKESENV